MSPPADGYRRVTSAVGAEKPRLLIATRSEHKLRELRGLLALPHGELVTLGQHKVYVYPDSVTSLTFRGLRPNQAPAQ